MSRDIGTRQYDIGIRLASDQYLIRTQDVDLFATLLE